jgi:hypothetical protein
MCSLSWRGARQKAKFVGLGNSPCFLKAAVIAPKVGVVATAAVVAVVAIVMY